MVSLVAVAGTERVSLLAAPWVSEMLSVTEASDPEV